MAFGAAQFLFDVVQGIGVVVIDRKVREFGQIPEGLSQASEPVHDRLQGRPLPSQGLGAIRFVPKFRVGEFALDRG